MAGPLETPASLTHHKRMLTRRTFLAALLPVPAAAQEFVAVSEIISDDDFYRLVSCGAAPDAECTKPQIRWPRDRQLRLRVGIAGVGMSFPDYKLDLVDAALDAAIDEVNASGARLFLERAYEGAFDIPVYLLDTSQGGQISGTGNSELDGATISIGRVALRSRGPDITAAAIAISRDIRRREVASVILEELVQALGLHTDIASPVYRRSIFSEESNSVTRLSGQDAEALRRHYPRF
ncbi:DUF2927 domain-containing protein [Boseongicola sp. H5]|uniref:DUF2927 domain-containing protein n=1 Tax=Boseongicola sp. H5 TaxID=2763261 RepID=UPI001D0AD449